MAEVLAAQGGRVIAEEFGGLNHFQMWDAFHDADSPILRMVGALEQAASSRAGHRRAR